MASIPNNGYAAVMAGSNVYTGSNLYGSICPQTPLPPVVSEDLVNKLYVDALVGGGTVVSVSGGNNINMTGTLPAPIVNLRSPLTATLALGVQSITGSTGQLLLSDPTVAVSQSNTSSYGFSVFDTTTPAVNASLTNSGLLTQTAADALTITPTVINKAGVAPLEIISVASNIELNTPTVVTTSGSFQPATILDTFAGGAGTAGQVLSSLGGAGTKWITNTAGAAVTSITAGLNIGIDSTISSAPVVRVLQPLTSVLDIGTQNITGTTGYLQMTDTGAPATQSFTRASSVSVLDTTFPTIYSEMTKAQLGVITPTSDVIISNNTIAHTGASALTISSLASNIALNTPNVVTTSGSFQPATVLDTFASAAGTAGQVLSSLGGAGTKWITNAAGVGDLNDTLGLGNTATGTYATITLTDTDTGGQANPILTLNNTNVGVGGVAMELYKDKGSAGLAGEILFNQSVYGKDAGNAKQEYTRITHSIRDNTVTGEDGSIEFSCVRQGNMESFVQFQGFENEVNFQKPIDMVGNNIRSSTGSMTLTTAASAGLGNIVATAKAGVSLTASNGQFLSTATLGNYDILASSGSISLTANGGGNISISNGGGTFAQTASTSTYTSSVSSNFNAPLEYHQGKVVTAFSEMVYQSTYQPFIISTPTVFPLIGQFQREGQMTMLVNSLGDGGNELNIVPTADFTVSCMAFPQGGGAGIIVGGTNNITGLGEVRRGATLADVTNNAGTFQRINFPIPNQIVNTLYINETLFPTKVAIGGRFFATTSDFYSGTSTFPSFTAAILLADTTAGALTPLNMEDTSLFQNFGLDDEVLTINGQDTAFAPPTVAGGPSYILGGRFLNSINTSGGSQPVNHVVYMAANPQTGYTFSGEMFLEIGGGADDEVNTIMVKDDKIVFGGLFTTIYGSATPYLAYTDATLPFPSCSLLGSGFQPTGGAKIYVGREAINIAGMTHFGYVGTTDTSVAPTPYDLLKFDMTNLTAANPTVEKSFAAQVTGIGITPVTGILSFAGGFKVSTGAEAYCWDFVTPQFIDMNGYTLPWVIEQNLVESPFNFYVFKDPNNLATPPREMGYIQELAAGPVVISTDATTLPFVNFASPTLKFNTLTLSNRNSFAMGTLCGYGSDDVRMLFYATNGASFSNVP